MTPKESRIPVGSQFTPLLVSLPEFLRAVVVHSGDKTAMQKQVWLPPILISPPKKPPTARRASLPLEAAVQYGLLEAGTYAATKLARDLEKLPEDLLYDRFARHILLNCGGLRVVEGIQQMEADNEKITGDSLARYLSSQGFTVTEHNTAINSLRLWLAQAGVFPKRKARAWKVNEEKKRALLGLSDEQIMLLARLTEAQAAFVEGLCVTDPQGWIPATQIRDWAEAMKSVQIGRGSLPKEVLRDLQSIGLIEYRTKGTGGGKTSELRTTGKFKSEVLKPFVKNTIRDMDVSVSAYYRQRPEDIFAGLASKDKHRKGLALEAFTIYVMRLLGLRFVAWRKRAEAEVDALLEGILGPVGTRWQIQCKNTPSSKVGVEDVAKEVGLLPITKATHILFIANSRFSDDAVAYAKQVMRESPVGLYLLDKDDFEVLKESPARIGAILLEKAEDMLGFGRPPMFEG